MENLIQNYFVRRFIAIVKYGRQLTEYLMVKTPTYHKSNFHFKFGMLAYALYSVSVSILHFLHRPRGPPSLLQNVYRFPFPGVKRSGRRVDQPSPSNAEVEESVELYIYLLPSCPVTRRTLLFYFTYWHQR